MNKIFVNSKSKTDTFLLPTNVFIFRNVVILITKRQNETKPYFNHTEGIETKYENHISSATDNFSVVSIY